MNAETTRNSEIGAIIRKYRSRFGLADEIARKFMLASTLEPLADKSGCTTRYADLKDSKKLEFFIAAGINSGFSIARMVEYCQDRQMENAYSFFPEAVVASRFNRGGGKINQGILEAIIPIICAQVINFNNIKDRPLTVLSLATDYLKQTSKQDVVNLIAGKELANKISGVEHKYPVNRHDVGNVFEYYQAEERLEVERGDLTGILHNRQFLDGFSNIKFMLETMMASHQATLLEKTVQAYELVRLKHQEKIGVGLAADHCAVCLYVYLALIEHREGII